MITTSRTHRHVACDSCHMKKRHCDGGRPCYQCTNRRIGCGYDRKMKRTPQHTIQPAKSTQLKRKFTTLEEISPEDWQTYKTALEQFTILQEQMYQDYIHFDLYDAQIPEPDRRLLLELIQGNVDPSEIDPEHIYTGFLYCSAISIGLEKLNNSSYRNFGQKSYDLILTMMSSGWIQDPGQEPENRKLVIMDRLIKEVYTRIKRGDFWKAKYLAVQCKLIADITDKSKLRQEDPEGSLEPDLPSFLKLHLGTFDIFHSKSLAEKISVLKSFLNVSIDRVQVGTLVLTGLLLCCESEEVFSSLMKATFAVPIEPQYREAVIAYFSRISSFISQATADQKLAYFLSLAILKIRDEGSFISQELESALNFLRQVQYPDSNTCWLCGIGVSLSLMCGLQILSIQFQDAQSNINGNYSLEWNKKYQLSDKILSLSLDPVDSFEYALVR